jgi:hypothetical protein
MEASALMVILPKRFSNRNMLRLLCGAVAALRLVTMEHKGTYLLARTATSLRLPYV